MNIDNLYHNQTSTVDIEHMAQIMRSDKVRIERILSPAGCQLEEKWYDQDEHEWVTVLQGLGVIVFADARIVTLKAGDHITIPAHEKHRVIKTSTKETTIWLAVFYR